MIKQRLNVFETNSSAVHSLVYKNQTLSNSNLEVDKNGEIVVPLKYYGSEHVIYDSQIDKLSYLMTGIFELCGRCLSNTYESYYFTEVEEAICEYSNASSIRLEIDDIDEVGFNHQESPSFSFSDNNVLSQIDIYNESSILNFIFNNNICIITDRD